MAVTVAGLPFQFIQMNPASGNTGFFFKSDKDAYFFDGTDLTKITSANYPATTVHGVVYLDGTYYVMTPEGNIRGSELEDPLTWSALNSIQCQGEPDGGVAIARQLMYIVAFNRYSTEFFYDAGNPTGSPLSPISSAFLEVGCAAGDSVAQTENTTLFMGVTKQKGRSIYMLEGTTPKVVSTAAVDRILNLDDLAKVYAYCVRIAGHVFYILTMPSSNITLAYDITTQLWQEWSSSIPRAAKSISTLTQSMGVATATATAHGLSDGDYAIIAGAIPSGYNGRVTVSVISDDVFTYPVSSSLAATATGTKTVVGFDQTYFKKVFYTAAGNLDVVQGEDDGCVYILSTDVYMDHDHPIDVSIRTRKFDGGTQDTKFFRSLELVGDKIATQAMIRYSDDDYQSWSAYRRVNLNQDRVRLSRMGTGRRRAFEVRHIDSTAFNVDSLELDVDKGIS